MQEKSANGLKGALFTPQTFREVRLWVQDRAVQGEIVATESRLYLPVGNARMVVVEEGDTVWFDPEDSGPNPFSIERA
jgi:hypothetical protein|tara:strand:- start:23248 stop:23481 length:234 start_codon:yes stop_codon:yes gene_type:complete